MLPVPGLDTGKMEEEEVGWWAKQMVRSVSWLHNLGYVHR
jgi:serine/threonine protein kinase